MSWFENAIGQLIVGPVNCEWDEWKIGECDQTCGGGIRRNTRKIKVNAKHGGKECEGSATSTETCNTNECPGMIK